MPANCRRQFRLTNEDLETLFSQVGKVASTAVVSDKFSGQPRGFGFVKIESSGDAAKAITEFDGKDVTGRNLKVNETKPRESGGGWRDSRASVAAAASAGSRLNERNRG
jgi:RNA recognition motif-containing protein